MFDLTNLKPRQIEFPLVSVVIPCYNVEQYIDQCLNSILNNGYSNIEVICVDDHSTDKTVEHIQNLMKSHSNIQLYDNGADHNIYGGACRNIGMQYAKGKYIHFCDSDDYVLPGMFQTCVSKCDSLNADMCMFKFQCVNQVGRLSRPSGIDFNFILDKSKETFDFRGTKNILTMGCICAWNKFFNRDFIVKIGARFQETKNSNDQTFVVNAELKAKRVVAMDRPFYVHRNNTSTSVQRDRLSGNSQNDILEAFESSFEIAKSLNDVSATQQFEGHVYNELRYMKRCGCRFTAKFVEEIRSFAQKTGIYHLGVKAEIDHMTGMENGVVVKPQMKLEIAPSQSDIGDVWRKRFDKIVCVHYLPYKDRVPSITSQLKRVGILDLPQFEWCYTVDNQYSRYLLNGIPRSRIYLHSVKEQNIKYTIDSYSLLKRLQYFGYEHVLILEDDIMFHKDLKFIADVVNSTPEDFDVMNYDPFVARNPITGKEPRFWRVNENIRRYGQARVFNMSCCALSRRMIDYMVEMQEVLLKPFDHYTWDCKNANMNTYCAMPQRNICIQNLWKFDERQSKNCYRAESKYREINKSNYFDIGETTDGIDERDIGQNRKD